MLAAHTASNLVLLVREVLGVCCHCTAANLRYGRKIEARVMRV